MASAEAVTSIADTEGRSPRGAAFAYVTAVVVVLALVWVISFAWWLLLPEARIVVVEVPRGTAQAIARGERPEVIPSTLLLRRGDTLAIQNEDDVVHRVGVTSIAPNHTERITAIAAARASAIGTPAISVGTTVASMPGRASAETESAPLGWIVQSSAGPSSMAASTRMRSVWSGAIEVTPTRCTTSSSLRIASVSPRRSSSVDGMTSGRSPRAIACAVPRGTSMTTMRASGRSNHHASEMTQTSANTTTTAVT